MKNIFIKYANYKNMLFSEKFGFLVLFIFLLMTIFPSLIATHDPLEQDIISRLQNPSIIHFFGTDELGRDIFSRCVYGTYTSVSTAFIAVIFALIVGVSTGLFSGYSGGTIDEVLSRFNDFR